MSERIKRQEILRMKPVTAAMGPSLLPMIFGGESIVGQAAIYSDYEYLRSIFFAQLIGRGRGQHIEVSGR